jgi:hypothetical protein
MPHIRVRNSQALRFPSKILFFDTETKPVENIEIKLKTKDKVLKGVKHECFLIVSHLYVLNSKFYELQEVKVFYNKTDFTRYVMSLENITCIAHSLYFDFIAAIDVDLLKSHKYQVVSFCTERGRTFFILKNSKRKVKITFVDSINYFLKYSIKDLGKIVHLRKYKMPSYSDDIKKWIRYCNRDVEILAKATLKLFKMFYGKVKFCFTLPAFTFLLYRRYFMKEKVYGVKHKVVNDLERAAYCGGRVEVFREGDLYNVYHLDVNSMYPYVMLNPMPVFCDRFYQSPSGDLMYELFYYLNRYPKVHVIAQVEVNVPDQAITPFPLKHNKKLYFPAGKFVTVLCTPELLLHKEYITKCYKLAVYKAKPIFTRFVKHFTRLKQAAKNRNDITSYVIYKLMLNSLYGKFAQRVRYYEKCGKLNKSIGSFLTKNGRFYVLFNNVYKRQKTKDAKYNVVAISAVITSYARAYLYQIMKQCYNVYYCDTDSVMCDYQSYKKLCKLGYVNNNELGKLKLKGVYEHVTIKAAKYYETEKEKVVAGLPKNASTVDDKYVKWERTLNLQESIRYLSNLDIVFIECVKRLPSLQKKKIIIQSSV